MSKKDKIIEEIKELRLWRGVFIGICFTLGSWLVGNIEKYNTFKFFIGIIFEIVSLIEIFSFNKKIKVKITELEDIK